MKKIMLLLVSAMIAGQLVSSCAMQDDLQDITIENIENESTGSDSEDHGGSPNDPPTPPDN